MQKQKQNKKQKRRIAYISCTNKFQPSKFIYFKVAHDIVGHCLLSEGKCDQKPQKPPSLLAEEVFDLIKKTANLKHRTLLMFSYSAGLGVSELVTVKIENIDSKRMMIHIHGAKGKKDRMILLFRRLLETLRAYYKVYWPKHYLFEGEEGGAYSARSAQAVLKEAKQRAGIRKKGSIHLLRHSYATHLLEGGTDIRYIKAFLGHNNLQTTMRYTNVSRLKIVGIQSPLNKLNW